MNGYGFGGVKRQFFIFVIVGALLVIPFIFASPQQVVIRSSGKIGVQGLNMRIVHHGDIGNKSYTVEKELSPNSDVWTQVYGPTTNLDDAIDVVLDSRRPVPNTDYGTRVVYSASVFAVEVYNGISWEKVYSTTDAVGAINWAMSQGYKSIYVSNAGFEYDTTSALMMKDGVTLIFQSGTTIRKTNSGASASFSGVTNAHLICIDGKATLIGPGSNGNSAMFGFTDAQQCSIQHFNWYNASTEFISSNRGKFNWFEDINGYGYDRIQGGYWAMRWEVAPSNTFIDVVYDGLGDAHGSSGGYFGCDDVNGQGWAGFEIFLRCEFKNTVHGNGLYICSAGAFVAPGGVNYNVIKDCNFSGITGNGNSGLKFRPSSHNIVVGLFCLENGNGIQLGTGYPGDVGRPYTGTDYNYIQGVISKSGPLQTLGGEGVDGNVDGPFSASYNQLDLIIEDSWSAGIELNTGDHACQIINNHIRIECRRNANCSWRQAGIWLQTAGDGIVQGNLIEGIIEDNYQWGLVFNGQGVTNNTFIGTFSNNPSGNWAEMGGANDNTVIES
jgi:hypothetical protein